MRPLRIDLLPLLHLLTIFFTGTTLALASAADATQRLPRRAVTSYDPVHLQQAPSCPRHLFHAPRNATDAHMQPGVMREQPALAHDTHPDPTPFSSLPQQRTPPSMSADHCRTGPSAPHEPEQPLSQRAILQARSRIRAVVLGSWPAGKPLLHALVPASWWVETRGGGGAEHARRRDLSAVAASALRLGSPSLHVAAAVSGLLLLGTIMCTL